MTLPPSAEGHKGQVQGGSEGVSASPTGPAPCGLSRYASQAKPLVPDAALAIEACRLGVLYDDMLRGYAGPISECGALLAGDMPNIDAAYDAWAEAARRAIGAPILPLPEGTPGA